MFLEWFREYRSLMLKSRFLSQFGACLMAAFSLLELWNTFLAVSTVEHISEEVWHSVYKILVLHALVGIIFAYRFLILSFNKSKYPITSHLTWLFGSTLILYHLLSTFLRYEGHIIHMMNDHLIIVEFFIIVLGSIRLVATSWISFNRSNEFNSYR